MLERTEAVEPLEFNSSSDPTVGVDMEVWQVNKESRSLVSLAPRFLERFNDEAFVKKELWQSMLELITFSHER